MFYQALIVTLRILTFRAGPQDFPYAQQPALTYVCVAFAVLANAAVARLVAPWSAALALGVVVVAALWLYTRLALRMRGLDNRLQQTFNSLLTTSSVLTLALWPPAARLVPAMQQMLEQLAKNPDAMQHPESLPQMNGSLVLLIYLILFWQFAVTVNIFRHATDTRPLGGVLIALLCVFNVLLFEVVASPLIQWFGG
jgi:hypothetical protein